jgi:hypothetical protein
VLLETPHCRPERPFYIAGPHDDVKAVTSRLDARVGPDWYDLVTGFDDLDDLDEEEADGDIFGDAYDDEPFDDDDDDVMTVEGVEAPPVAAK